MASFAPRKVLCGKPNGEHTIPITPYLGDESFEPETVAIMSAAFQNVCRALELSAQRDAATDLVAMKIIELARAGERDPDELTARVMDKFGVREF